MTSKPIDPRALDLLRVENERLSRLGIIGKDKEARARIHQGHVDALTRLLREPVRRALDDETQSLSVAGTWVNEADQLREWLSLRDAPGSEELGRQPSLSTWESIRKLFVNLGAQSANAAQAARDQVARELAGALSQPNLPRASQQEVEDHAVELSQLLVSNWFGVLEHAMQDAGAARAVRLIDALPESAKPEDLLEGCEAFALPRGECAKVLLDYQRHLARRKGAVALSPTLQMEHSHAGWVIHRPTAQHAVAEELDREPLAIGATTIVSPWAIGRPLDAWGAREGHVFTTGEEATMVAAALETLAFESQALHIAPVAKMFSKDFACVKAQVELDLPQAALQQWHTTSETMPLCHLDAAIDVQTVPDSTAVYRVALTAAAVTLLADPQRSMAVLATKKPMLKGLDGRQRDVVMLGVDFHPEVIH